MNADARKNRTPVSLSCATQPRLELFGRAALDPLNTFIPQEAHKLLGYKYSFSNIKLSLLHIMILQFLANNPNQVRIMYGDQQAHPPGSD